VSLHTDHDRIFGIPQVIEALMSEQDILVAVLDKTRVRLKEILVHWWTALRSGLIGVGIGIIPGVERTWPHGSLRVAKKGSKHP